jgi:hypothetical protein
MDNLTKDILNKMETYLKKINSSFKGLEPTPNGDSYFTVLNLGAQPFFIFFIPQLDLIYYETPLRKLPTNNLLPFYQRLLELNNGETIFSYFALNERTNEVVLQLMRPATGIDFEEFNSNINVIVGVYNKIKDEIARF